MEFKSAEEYADGDGFFYLLIEKKDGDAKFKTTAQEICDLYGKERNRYELQSEKDGTKEVVKYEQKYDYEYIRFNLTFL
ncbi:unnamed protein product [Oikopleura dioica]|uniref:Uncharacterized protein n=1 Tax=Oikopleura dioica TaxID=34765 RepID=E4YAN5_OIKDI|nr:unnamed protein product [Oikopleura dioica]